MSSKEFYIRLTLGVYKVSALFPEKEPLKRDIRELADEILVSLLVGYSENRSRNIEGMNRLLDLAESREWADPRNFSVLRREYAKLGDNRAKPVDNSFLKPNHLRKKTKERQEKIAKILKENGKVKVGDLKKTFPELARRTLIRDLENCLRLGILVRSGNGRGTYYTSKNVT